MELKKQLLIMRLGTTGSGKAYLVKNLAGSYGAERINTTSVVATIGFLLLI